MPACREVFFQHMDPSSLIGIEIGPLDNPVVRKEEGEVYYIDYTDTDGLRKWWHTIPPENIEEVDFVWRGGSSLINRIGRSVDYVIANHVLEHVPDLLGWLREVHSALEIGGVLCLTIPDKRFTFDIRRTLSTLGEVIESNVNKLRRPPLKALIDQVAYGAVVEKVAAWKTGPQHLVPCLSERAALEESFSYIARWCGSQDYIDAHVWVFTPISFICLLHGLAVLKMFPFKVKLFLGTAENEYDFHCHLEARPDPDDPVIAESINAAMAAIVGSSAEKLYYSRGL